MGMNDSLVFHFRDYLGVVNEYFIGLSICKANILSILSEQLIT